MSRRNGSECGTAACNAVVELRLGGTGHAAPPSVTVSDRERDRDASACIRRHEAFARALVTKRIRLSCVTNRGRARE